MGVFGIAWLGVALFDRKKRPAEISPEAAQKYPALVFLIRFAVPLIMVAVLVLFGLGFLIEVDLFRRPSLLGSALSVLMLTLCLIVGPLMAARLLHRSAKSGAYIYRRIQFLNVNEISNFAFIFAAIGAHDFYQLMPPASRAHPSFFDRDFVWIIIFLVVYRGLRLLLEYLLRPQSPDSQPSPDDPGLPQYPLKRPPFAM